MEQFEEKEIELIEKVKELLKNNKSKEEYSIFDVEEVGQKEVIMCRVLADFLDPNGKHNQGDIYLNNFYAILKEKTNGIEYSCQTEDEIQIIKERATESNKNTKKRIDIVINNKTQNLFLPIEVKINADEQQKKDEGYEQCQFYLDKAKNMYGQNGNARLVFLTKDGRYPKTIEEDNDKGKVICLSWEEDITKWIDESIKITKDLAIISILKQFKLTIQRFTYNMQDKEFELIKKFIVKDENMKFACKIKEKIGDYKNTFKNNIEEIIFNISNHDKFNENNEIIFGDCIKSEITDFNKNEEGFVFGKLEDGYGFGLQLKPSCKENDKRNKLLEIVLSEFDYDTQEDWGIWINKIFFYDYNYDNNTTNKNTVYCKDKDIIQNINQINVIINKLKTNKNEKEILIYADKIAKVYERINTINYVLEQYFINNKIRVISSSVSGNYVRILYNDKEYQFNFSIKSNFDKIQVNVDEKNVSTDKIGSRRNNPYRERNFFVEQIKNLKL